MGKEGGNFSPEQSGMRSSNLKSRVLGAPENIINSMRVAPQWHIPGIVFGVVAALGAREGYYLERDSIGVAAAAGVTLVSATASGFCELGVIGYLLEYKKMKSSMDRHGWDERIVADKVDYFCGRRAARIASIDAGYKQEFNQYLDKLNT